MRVLRHDDTPAPNEKIQICLKVRGKIEWDKDVVECRDFMSSPDGFVDFVVPPQHKNIVLLSFVATAVDYPTTYYPPDQRWKVSNIDSNLLILLLTIVRDLSIRITFYVYKHSDFNFS